MTEITDWFQNNWIDLARLLVQCAILAAVVRYGRKLLAALRASQEQMGALLKLSVSDAVAEQPAPVAEVSKGYETPAPAPKPSRGYEPASIRLREPEPEREPELQPVFAGGGSSRNSYAAEREQSLGGRLAGTQTPVFSTPDPAFSTPASRAQSASLTPWVSAPATEPERLSIPTAPIAARAGVSSWLQAPMRSSSSVSPWRKVVRWLQAPAGH